MSDLERVRDELRAGIGRKRQANIIDAHLKEDDEREKECKRIYDRWVRWQGQAEAAEAVLEMLVDGYGHTWPMNVLKIVDGVLKREAT